jgi:murein DD-endopeptidase MepM/ murein hydrolase activator NlpD
LSPYRFRKLLPGLLLALALLFQASLGVKPGAAQQNEGGPVYVVQPGDSLWSIAARFRVSVDDLASINNITNPGALGAGARLVIPGLDGIQGELTTREVAFGETLYSLSKQHNIPIDTLIHLNHITSPAELYAGATLVMLKDNATALPTHRALLAEGQSLLELAVAQGVSPYSYVLANDLPATWAALPGQVLLRPGTGASPGTGATAESESSPGALPEVISSVALTPTVLIQGKAAAIEVAGQESMSLGGSLTGHELHFFPQGSDYVSLQGIHAMTEPGLYTLVLSGTLPSEAPYFGARFAFAQAVLVEAGGYPFDPVLTVSPETIDPAVTRPEDAEWAALTAPATPEKLWTGLFQSPALPPYNDCWPSRYGSRRSYNGSAYIYFHSGLDFCGGVGNDIVAPATGKVVFAGPLTVRGNATVIDHGWGIYSAYLHQSEILVRAGDLVQPGQVIGKVGGTGRVTGPHLHWEVWAGGVQVDPMDWLLYVYPP